MTLILPTPIGTLKDPNNTGNVKNSIFANFGTQTGLIQHVHSSTCGSNILVLIFSTSNLTINNMSILPPPSSCDHSAITFIYCATSPSVKYKINQQYPSTNLKNNFNAINIVLKNIDWLAFFSTCISMNEYCLKFHQFLLYQLNIHNPIKKITNFSCKLGLPKSIVKLIN